MTEAERMMTWLQIDQDQRDLQRLRREIDEAMPTVSVTIQAQAMVGVRMEGGRDD